MRETVIARVGACKLIAIVRGQATDTLEPLAQALLAGGIDLLEITFDQKHPDSFAQTAKGIGTLSRRFGDRLLVGAGTVMTCEQARMAFDAGARYIISPGVNRRVIEETRRLGMVSMPGAMTPTEIASAYEMGADLVKVFPAGSLGSGYIKALKAPLAHIPLMAVGGIDEKNAGDFLRAGAMGLGVGGKLVNKEWIALGAFDRIAGLAKEYVRVVAEVA